MQCWLSNKSARGWPVPDKRRYPDLDGLKSGELERIDRELRTSPALAFPDSLVRRPILAHLSAIDAELTERGGQDRADEVAS
jgi:hypothetical protein